MKNKLIKLELVLLFTVMLGSCSKHIVMNDYKCKYVQAIPIRMVVTSEYGSELVEGDIEKMDDCIKFSTIIRGKSVRRMICGQYMISAFEDVKNLNKQLKN